MVLLTGLLDILNTDVFFPHGHATFPDEQGCTNEQKEKRKSGFQGKCEEGQNNYTIDSCVTNFSNIYESGKVPILFQQRHSFA